MKKFNIKKFKLISFKTKKDTITSIIVFIAIAVIIFSAVNIVEILYNYEEGVSTYDSLESDVSDFVEVSTDEDGEGSFTLDFEALQEVCPDAVGWIWQDGTVISYPILQTTDNEYYLTHLYDGTENSSGSIFVDCNISDGLEATHAIVYGHNMKNDSMFGSLQEYKNEEYFEEHPTFNIYVGDTQYVYYIFSVYVTDDTSDTYTIGFADEAAYQEYLDMAYDNSRYDTGVEVTTADKIITLSTCTGTTGGDQRLVVQIVRGEEVTNSDDSEETTAAEDTTAETETTTAE